MKTNDSESTIFLDGVPVSSSSSDSSGGWRRLSCRSCIWGWRWTWRRTWWPCWRPPGSPSRWRSSCGPGWQTCRPLCTRCGSRRLAGSSNGGGGSKKCSCFKVILPGWMRKLLFTAPMAVATQFKIVTELFWFWEMILLKRSILNSENIWQIKDLIDTQQCTLVVTDQNKNWPINLNTRPNQEQCEPEFKVQCVNFFKETCLTARFQICPLSNGLP